MKKTMKGALAAGAAGALLLGGAGSLAYWTADGTATGGTINSGTLSLTAASPACTAWALDTAETDQGSPAWAMGDPIVPGDVLTEVCTYTIGATGNHLIADLAVSTPGFTGTANALSGALVVDASYKVGTTPTQTTITSADNTKSLVATVKVTFPYGGPVSTPDPTSDADNTTQGLQAVLDDITITATQTHTAVS